MTEIFVSYERSNARQARQVADAIRSLGYGVWLDDDLPAHRAYTTVIEERLRSAAAVVVVWSAQAVESEWVRSEANRGREDRKLVQLRIEDARLPMPFDQIQCADLMGWNGVATAPAWRKVAASHADLTGSNQSKPIERVVLAPSPAHGPASSNFSHEGETVLRTAPEPPLGVRHCRARRIRVS